MRQIPVLMKLIATPDNPIPPGAILSAARAIDGAPLRVARWVPPTARRGTVAILPGRAEFIEKYFETVGELIARGFAVAALDWRGQGGSPRQLKNPRKGHVDDFSLYERDLSALVDDVLGPSCPQPWFGLAHSVGAAIMLAVAHAGRCPFERLVLSSPMISLANQRYPWLMRIAAEGLDTLGFGGAFAPGGGAAAVSAKPFADNVLTSDPKRYARTAAIIAAAPDLAIGWPTIGWLHAAIRTMREFTDPDFAREIATPILIVAAGRDRVVDTRAAERFASHLRTGRLIVIDGAEHEILVERDSYRELFWTAFDQFIPGIEGERTRARISA
ncbi:MAG TPA: alpha/beta hydrolase [Roseiarcus sp.]|nr:alpha/beta hydrolase [Roseiarcus sp.]